MKTKKIPMRTCVVTKERFEKRDLLRVIRTPEGTVKVDESLKANGRGAYLKKDKSVILKAKENKILNRVLEVDVPDEIYLELLNLIEG